MGCEPALRGSHGPRVPCATERVPQAVESGRLRSGGRMKLLTLSQADVTGLLDLDRLLDALEDGFRALSSGRVEVPARTAANAENQGWLASMPGYGEGLGLGGVLTSWRCARTRVNP